MKTQNQEICECEHKKYYFKASELHKDIDNREYLHCELDCSCKQFKPKTQSPETKPIGSYPKSRTLSSASIDGFNNRSKTRDTQIRNKKHG